MPPTNVSALDMSSAARSKVVTPVFSIPSMLQVGRELRFDDTTFPVTHEGYVIHSPRADQENLTAQISDLKERNAELSLCVETKNKEIKQLTETSQLFSENLDMSVINIDDTIALINFEPMQSDDAAPKSKDPKDDKFSMIIQAKTSQILQLQAELKELRGQAICLGSIDSETLELLQDISRKILLKKEVLEETTQDCDGKQETHLVLTAKINELKESLQAITQEINLKQNILQKTTVDLHSKEETHLVLTAKISELKESLQAITQEINLKQNMPEETTQDLDSKQVAGKVTELAKAFQNLTREINLKWDVPLSSNQQPDVGLEEGKNLNRDLLEYQAMNLAQKEELEVCKISLEEASSSIGTLQAQLDQALKASSNNREEISALYAERSTLILELESRSRELKNKCEFIESLLEDYSAIKETLSVKLEELALSKATMEHLKPETNSVAHIAQLSEVIASKCDDIHKFHMDSLETSKGQGELNEIMLKLGDRDSGLVRNVELSEEAALLRSELVELKDLLREWTAAKEEFKLLLTSKTAELAKSFQDGTREPSFKQDQLQESTQNLASKQETELLLTAKINELTESLHGITQELSLKQNMLQEITNNLASKQEIELLLSGKIRELAEAFQHSTRELGLKQDQLQESTLNLASKQETELLLTIKSNELAKALQDSTQELSLKQDQLQEATLNLASLPTKTSELTTALQDSTRELSLKQDQLQEATLNLASLPTKTSELTKALQDSTRELSLKQDQLQEATRNLASKQDSELLMTTKTSELTKALQDSTRELSLKQDQLQEATLNLASRQEVELNVVYKIAKQLDALQARTEKVESRQDSELSKLHIAEESWSQLKAVADLQQNIDRVKCEAEKWERQALMLQDQVSMKDSELQELHGKISTQAGEKKQLKLDLEKTIKERNLLDEECESLSEDIKARINENFILMNDHVILKKEMKELAAQEKHSKAAEMVSVACNTEDRGFNQENLDRLQGLIKDLKVKLSDSEAKAISLDIQIKYKCEKEIKRLEKVESEHRCKILNLKEELRSLTSKLETATAVPRKPRVQTADCGIQVVTIVLPEYKQCKLSGHGSGAVEMEGFDQLKERIRQLKGDVEWLKKLCRSRKERIEELEGKLKSQESDSASRASATEEKLLQDVSNKENFTAGESAKGVSHNPPRARSLLENMSRVRIMDASDMFPNSSSRNISQPEKNH